MPRHLWSWTLGLALLGSAFPPPEARAQAPGPIELRDGDRVVLVGGTLIEREAEFGYLETQIARRYPGRKIVVRNLGWSGDTVLGESRSVGNPVQDGFRQLVDHVVALKPTVIVLGYGANEAFDGAAGLPRFAANLARLWDALAPTGARFVVLLPPRQANLGPPLPDPRQHNADLGAYGAALRAEAERRGAVVVDLFDLVPERQGPNVGGEDLTTNGLHPNRLGYWVLAGLVARSALAEPTWLPPDATVDAATATAPPAADATVDAIERTPTGLRFRVAYGHLTGVAQPAQDEGKPPPARPARLVRVTGLPPGRYRLRIDGVDGDRDEDAAAWGHGLASAIPGEVDHVEALRRRIVTKNLMYFHRWRPQNETYLFGFRKYEQGRNAAELAAFDPLIAAEEAEIARLSRPVPHTYELTRTGDAAPATAPRTGEAPR